MDVPDDDEPEPIPAVAPTLEELARRVEARGGSLSLTEAADLIRAVRDART